MRRGSPNGDVLIVGDRVRTQPIALEAGAACLIVTTRRAAVARGAWSSPREQGRRRHRHRAATRTRRRVSSRSHTPRGDLMETDVLRVGPETLLAEAAEDLLGSHASRGRRGRRRRARRGHPDAHQRRARHPPPSRARRPQRGVAVGARHRGRRGGRDRRSPPGGRHRDRRARSSSSTCRSARRRPSSRCATSSWASRCPPPIAGVLLAALLTDTVILKSPTTTDADRRDLPTTRRERVGVDPMEFGMEVFRSRSAGEAFSAEKVVRTDVKEYRAGDVHRRDRAVRDGRSRPVSWSMPRRCAPPWRRCEQSRDYDLVVLMATDIVREGLRDHRRRQGPARRARARHRSLRRLGVDARRAVAQEAGRRAARSRPPGCEALSPAARGRDRRRGCSSPRFWELAEDFAYSPVVLRFDAAVSTAIHQLRHPVLT